MDNLFQRVAKDVEEGIEKKLDAKYATKFVERTAWSMYSSFRNMPPFGSSKIGPFKGLQRLTNLSASTPHRQTVQEFLSQFTPLELPAVYLEDLKSSEERCIAN